MANELSKPPILVAVANQALHEEVRRVAAAADRVIEAVTDPPSPRGTHTVIVDADAAQRWGRACAVDAVVCDGEPGLADWRAAAHCGAGQVVGLPDGGPALLRIIAGKTSRSTNYGSVVAVWGIRGASVFSAALGLESARAGNRTLLVDGDGSGAGLDLLLGVEEQPGLRWSGLVVDDGRVSATALRSALPRAAENLAVLSCARGEIAAPATEAMMSVATACATDGDVVVLDLSKRTVADTARIAALADLTVLVVPAELRPVAAARALISVLRDGDGEIGAVVRGPSPGGLSTADIAPLLGVPVLASMRPQPRLDAHIERGGLRVGRRSPLAVAANRVLEVAFAGAEAVAG